MPKIARHSFLVLLARLLEAVAAMLNSIILARMLGPGGRGKYGLILSIVMLLSVLGTLGITDSNVYLINRRRYSVHNFISNSICFAICSSVLWFVVFLLFYTLIGYRILPTLTLNEILLPLTILPFALLFVYLQNILLGIGAIHRFISANILFAVSPLLFLVVFLSDFRLTLTEAICAYMLSYVGTCSYTFWCCIREEGSFKFSPNAALAKESLNYGLKSNTGTILQIARDQLEIIILGCFMMNSAVGYYTIASGLSDRMKMLPKTVSYLLFAEVSKSDHESGDILTAKLARNLLWIMAPLAGILILFSKYIVLILYGREFLPGQVPMAILLGSTVLSAVTFPLGSLFLGQGRTRVYLYAGAVALVTTIGLDLWLIPLLGLPGAAIANTSGLAAMACLYFTIYRKNSANSIRGFLLLKKEDWHQVVDSLSLARRHSSLELARIGKRIIQKLIYGE